MSLFPFFVDVQGRAGMIIGGGKHALEKVQRLLPYHASLQVISEEICSEIENIPGIEIQKRKFQETDLDALPYFVIAAGDDPDENHQIAAWCRERRILVNVVDDPAYCDFIFPSLIAQGDLSIGICTNGASPGTGVLLKRKIQSQIPDQIEEILDFLQKKRPVISQKLTCKKKRFAFYYQISELCMSQNRPLTEEEFEELLNMSIHSDSEI